MIDCSAYYFEDHGEIPNNEVPLLLYPKVLSTGQTDSTSCKILLKEHGWSKAWVNGIFPYHHYHSTAHEVLAVVSGSAAVKLGGEQGKEVSLSTGDVILIPAGVGHCRLHSSPDFQVVGAYAGGRGHDICKGKAEERPQVIENIRQVPMPEFDPVTGQKDPLYQYWNLNRVNQ